MSKSFGKCALCRKECELSFEHIPPRAAFNASPAKPVTGDKMMSDERMPWDTSELRYTNQQQGMGKFSLCKDCNNNTGSWYGNDYIKISQIIHAAFCETIPDNINAIGIKEIYPLRFVKQIISMFCSINNFEDERIQPLRDFVLDKTTFGLDKSKYRLNMYFTKSNLVKYAPLSVVIKLDDNKVQSMAVSEITAYPLGFILIFDPISEREYDGVDITSFSDCGYDELATIEIPLCVKEMNDIFPMHYRSKEEIKQCIEENKKWSKDNEDVQ